MPEPEKSVNWTRRIGWTLVILVIVLFTAHALWTSIAASRLSRRITAIRDAGEPIDPKDFNHTILDSANNVGADILAAGKLIDPNTQPWKYFDDRQFTLPLSDQERQTLDAFVTANAAAVKRLDVSKGKTGLEWEIDYSQPLAWQNKFPEMAFARYIASAAAMQGLWEHEHGNDKAAIGRFDQLLLIGRFADRHPTLVGHLVSINMDELAMHWMSRIAPELKIGNGPNDVSPQDLRRIVDQLTGDDEIRLNTLQAIRGERMMDLDVVRAMLNGTPVPPAWSGLGTNLPGPLRYFARPVYLTTGSGIVQHMTSTLDAAKENSWPAVKAKLPPIIITKSPINQLQWSLTPSMERALLTHFEGLTDRHLTAVALAVRTYALDHDGQFPAKLEDLVPTYISAVPVDPMRADHKPLGYRPDPKQPLTYSVGTDGIDNGGSQADPSGRRKPLANQAPNEWYLNDRVLPLYRPAKPAPATGQAGG